MNFYQEVYQYTIESKFREKYTKVKNYIIEKSNFTLTNLWIDSIENGIGRTVYFMTGEDHFNKIIKKSMFLNLRKF